MRSMQIFTKFISDKIHIKSIFQRNKVYTNINRTKVQALSTLFSRFVHNYA